MGHQTSQARGNGVESTVCEVLVYRLPDVAGAGKRCREHRLRGNGVWVTKYRRRGETV